MPYPKRTDRPEVDSLESEINSGFGTDSVHRLVAEAVVDSKWLKDMIGDVLASEMHPEFGTAWREPDGEFSKVLTADREGRNERARVIRDRLVLALEEIGNVATGTTSSQQGAALALGALTTVMPSVPPSTTYADMANYITGFVEPVPVSE